MTSGQWPGYFQIPCHYLEPVFTAVRDVLVTIIPLMPLFKYHCLFILWPHCVITPTPFVLYVGEYESTYYFYYSVIWPDFLNRKKFHIDMSTPSYFAVIKLVMGIRGSRSLPCSILFIDLTKSKTFCYFWTVEAI